MTEQALIERIVADVMRQLMADASPAPEPPAPARSTTNRQVQVAEKRTSSVRLDVKVVTEDTLQESVNGHKTVEVGDKAIVTPSGRDWLRRNKVELLREKSSSGSQTDISRRGSGSVIVHSSSEAVEKVLDHYASTEGWTSQRVGCRNDAVSLAESTVNGDGSPVVVFTNEPEAVVCEANRNRDLRAAVVGDVTAVARVKESMQGNLFVISPSGRSFFELRYLLHSLV